MQRPPRNEGNGESDEEEKGGVSARQGRSPSAGPSTFDDYPRWLSMQRARKEDTETGTDSDTSSLKSERKNHASAASNSANRRILSRRR